MRERIICRFAKEEDLIAFSKRNNFELNQNVKEFNVHTKEYVIKKSINKNAVNTKKYWETEWFNMPEYISEKQEVYAKIEFIFNYDDLELAKNIFDQNITEKTTSVWFPKLIAGQFSQHRVVGGSSQTKYPIYIVSKNRHDKCYTSQFLTQMEVKHYIVVEPQDVKLYKSVCENQYATVLELNMSYKDNYDTFDELGDTKSKGPGGARNFCWEHSMQNGYEWHWVMDDNTTEGFHYMWRNHKIKCRTGAIFRACEDFVDRYENIAIAGLNYSKFCKECDKTPAFVMNTRIYSFLLIRNDIPYRWRGRYNEDTDLSLRVLKDGWCTVQFNAFLAGKCTTQVVKGGNTEEFYAKEGTYPKSKMLEDMHPDVAKVVWKFNRWHHQVDYSGFTQKLKLKEGIERVYVENDYGMQIIKTEETNTSDNKTYLETKYKQLIQPTNKQNNITEVSIKMDKKEKVLTFQNELKWISNKDIRKFAVYMIAELPDYFFVVPASSTGKYHPTYSLGEGGLVRHTKSAVLLAKTLLDLEQYKSDYSEEERDIMLTALLLHDGVKHGLNGSKYTVSTHPTEMVDFINDFIIKKDLNPWDDMITIIQLICKCIATHMGEFNKDYKTGEEVLDKPETNMQKFVHMCDYLASRRFIEINFNKVDY